MIEHNLYHRNAAATSTFAETVATKVQFSAYSFHATKPHQTPITPYSSSYHLIYRQMRPQPDDTLQIPTNNTTPDESAHINLSDACCQDLPPDKIQEIITRHNFNRYPSTNNISHFDQHHRTALHYAALKGRPRVIKLLLENGFSANQPDKHGTYPLHFAIQCKNYNAAIQLCQVTDPKMSLFHKENVIHSLCKNQYDPKMLDLLSELMAQKYDINVIDQRKCNALFYAVDKPLLVQKLIEYGIDIHHKDGFGRTPLFFAVYATNTESTELLIRSGADVEIRNSLQHTPLMLASVFGNVHIINTLLRNGAQVNAIMNRDGKSWASMCPLSMAIRHENYDIAMVLVENGARMDWEIGHGLMVWDLLIDVGHHSGYVESKCNSNVSKDVEVEFQLDDVLDIRELHPQPRTRRTAMSLRVQSTVTTSDMNTNDDNMNVEQYTLGNITRGIAHRRGKKHKQKKKLLEFMISVETEVKMQALCNSKIVQDCQVPQSVLHLIASPLLWH